MTQIAKVQKRNTLSLAIIDQLIKITKTRLTIEKTYSASLNKLSPSANNVTTHETTLPTSTSTTTMMMGNMGISKLDVDEATIPPLDYSSSLGDALIGFVSDISNKAVQHRELADSLNLEILAPLIELRGEIVKGGKALTTTTSSVSSRMKSSLSAYTKLHTKYDRAFHEATMHW